MGSFVARQLLWQAMCASQVILPAFRKSVDGTQLSGAILKLVRQRTPAELQYFQVQVMN